MSIDFSDESSIAVRRCADSSDEPSEGSLMFFLNFIEQSEAQDTTASTRRSKARDRVKASEILVQEYFNDNSKYNDKDFRDRYRLHKSLFLNIVETISTRYDWFQEGVNRRGKPSFTPIQKSILAMSQLV
jgi:hypothetical protein